MSDETVQLEKRIDRLERILLYIILKVKSPSQLDTVKSMALTDYIKEELNAR